jgi:nucleotide-binding universal stress UspA family protein
MALAPPDAELVFLAVGDDAAPGAETAAREARERGVAASARTVDDANAPEAVIDASAGADLLVVAAGGTDVLLGANASAAIHAAPLPVLVARPREPEEVAGLVLVATDGSREAARAVELGAAIARAGDAPLALVHVTDRHVESREPAPTDAAADAGADVIEEHGEPAAQIVDTARRERAALVVIGSRGLGRARILGSVGERVAHEAPCSVLVLREPAA